jgi:2-polyprenyl-3-methyl-5-hydroxy-6-metoxy-1,4-benzoquinol methylase
VPLLPPLARAAHAVEMLDRPAPPSDLAESLTDVARLNTLFGGCFVTLANLKRLIAGVARDRRITVLDVGTGGADIPRALVRWARRAGRPIRVIALDRDHATLGLARRRSARYPEIVVLEADALALPVRADVVDVAISALMLHHLEPADAVRSLSEMDAAAGLGVVVNDLMRSRIGYALVWLATRVFTNNRMSRHDGPLSVRRAYTPEEVRALCEKAGLFDVRVHRYRMFVRQCAVRAKP